MVEERQNTIDPSEVEKAHTETAQRLKSIITANGITAKHLDHFSVSREGTEWLWDKLRGWARFREHQPFLNVSSGGLPNYFGGGYLFELTVEGRFRCYCYYSHQYGEHPDQRETHFRQADIPPETNFATLEEEAKLVIEDLKKLKLKAGVSPDGLPEDIYLVDQPRRYTYSVPSTL